MVPRATTASGGPLRPGEMAQAAAIAALCAATSILSALIPLIAGLSRWGLSRWGCSRTATDSAFVGGTVAGCVIAFVAAGTVASAVLGCAYIGGITRSSSAGAGLCAVYRVAGGGILASVASVAALMVLSRLRELAFARCGPTSTASRR